MKKPWTTEKVIERVRQLAENHNVDVLFGQPMVKEFGGNTGLSVPPDATDDGKKGIIFMGDPREDYTSPEHFVLVFLRELQRFIYIETYNCPDAGAYGEMLKNEGFFKREIWCWNGALDMAKMIFGLELTIDLAKWISADIQSYAKEQYLA